MKENLPAHHYPQLARSLGKRQMPKAAAEPARTAILPGKAIGHGEVAEPATEPRSKAVRP
jgi:hypothetical protein